MPEIVNALHFSTRKWDGPGGIFLQQGVKWAGKDFYVYQGDKKPSGEDLIIRRYNEKFEYEGYQVVPNGGHGTSTGVIQINPTTSRHIIPANSRGIRVVDYVIGNQGTPKSVFFGATGYCSAVSCNNAANRLSVRKGGTTQTVTWFNRDEILKGNKPAPLLKYSFKTPGGSTFQGHYNFGDADYFHWETDGVPRGSKNYHAWVDRFVKGKKVATLDTKPWLPKGEPEGLMGYNGKLYFVKKDPTPPRHLFAVPCNF